MYAVVGEKTGTYYNLCNEANIEKYTRIKGYDQNVVEAMLNVDLIYKGISNENLFILIPSCIVGIIASAVVIIFVLFKKRQERNSLGKIF